MDKQTKNKIKSIVLALRQDFEKEIANRLNNMGISPDKEWKDGRSLPHLSDDEIGRNELEKRRRIAAFINREIKAGQSQKTATEEFIREASYTWINRLIGLKCLESQDLIEEVITTRPEYGNRSKQHRDFRERNPEVASRSDDGLIGCLFSAFEAITEEIRVLFDPKDEYSLIIPRYPVLKNAIEKINTELDYETYQADDFLGWVYQYFNSKEKDKVFEEVRTKKKKIAGNDIINATQLYTEKYMVHFLVENSLGAMWMEMYPNSPLSSRWEYFVKDPNDTIRETKPVKEIKFLDPACGSGHFLLYAFDLFYAMYEEEGIIPREQIPEFILKYNLHGIDIDQRAIQLSALGLYMKLKSKNPNMKIQQMNLVSANAVMLNSDILEEFLQDFKDDKFAQELITTIWHGLANVREIGFLLKIEEQIDEVVKKQKDNRLDYFIEGKMKSWEKWKQEILGYIRKYYQKASLNFDLNKQLFASEAYKGVQFLDLLEQKYDIVATNPPYMNVRTMGEKLSSELKKLYPASNIDLYASFLDRCISITEENGYSALITQQTFMFTTNYKDFRKEILEKSIFRTLAHLGPHAFEDINGEKVNSSMFSIKKSKNEDLKGCFIRVIKEKNKASKIVQSIKNKSYYVVGNDYFKIVPEWPFVYWIDGKILKQFHTESFFSDYVEIISGAVTGDNDLFLRYSWEIKSNEKFIGYAKGGDFNKYYGNLELSILDSKEKIKAYKSGRVRAFDFKDHEKITYTLLSSKGFSARYLPKNYIFDHNANSIIMEKINLDIFYILGWLNSSMSSLFLSILNPTISFTNNDLLRLPFKTPLNNEEETISHLSRSCVKIKKDLLKFEIVDREFEVSAIHWGLSKLMDEKNRN